MARKLCPPSVHSVKTAPLYALFRRLDSQSKGVYSHAPLVRVDSTMVDIEEKKQQKGCYKHLFFHILKNTN